MGGGAFGSRGAALLLATGLALGVMLGVGGFTFVYADGASYMRDDPVACANCHVMQGQYDGWVKSSHHAVATCNDCHVPHGSLYAALLTKARNGFHHSWAFTTGDFHEPIMIGPANRAVTEGACRACHGEVTQAIDAHGTGEQALDCIRCHAEVGHSR
jgi:cytochrome c nitrite reductase small subunit